MKNLMRIGLAFTLAFAAYGCGGDDPKETTDAGVTKDAGTKDSGPNCPTEWCNGVCCPTGQFCDAMTMMCTTPCAPNCYQKACGAPDGCGGTCYGTCTGGQTCDPVSKVCTGTCTPNCAGAVCGQADGCGGKCDGTCGAGQVCNTQSYTCQTQTCTPNCAGATCGQADSCGGQCLGSCPSGQYCNSASFTCQTGTCTPNCAGATCGQSDTCGGQCLGSCPTGQTCNASTFVCETGTCTPNCAGAACGGSDGCGGQCVGSCPTGQTCNASTLVCETSTSTCTLAPSQPMLTITDEAAYGVGTDGVTIEGVDLISQINQDSMPDYLRLNLFAGYGVFMNGIQPGTYQLTGDELNYATCGLCVLLYGDVDPATGSATDVYFQTGGGVTISSISGQLQATLLGVSFEHVTIDASTYESTPVGDGCTSTIGTATINSTMVQQ